LEKFGVDVDAIHNTLTAPKRLFKCSIEYWEMPLLRENDALAKYKLQQKYKGLVMCDIDLKIVYTISADKMQYDKGRNGGWAVLTEPSEYDGTNDDILVP